MPSEPYKRDTNEIVVSGDRASAETNVAPIATLDTATIAATGATTIPDLLRAIRGTVQSADGSDPIMLLNAQRVSGYQEISSLPTEAIEKIEVFPEATAVKFGFPPTRRVLNFITKRHFRQVELRGSAGIATRGGGATEKANIGLTRLRGDARLTLTLEVRHTDPLFVSDRDIAADPDVPFDPIGNVLGTNGEIDLALSAAAGHVVRIARVPGAAPDRTSLGGYVAGADDPRLFNLGPFRSLAARNDAVKAEAVLANRIGKTLAGSVSLSAEKSRDRGFSGLSPATLIVPASNPYSPFGRTVLLDRYLIEAPALRQNQTTTSLHAGFMLRGAIAGWRWDLTGMFDQQVIEGVNEQSIDVSAANAAIANGANPFAPLDATLLTNRLVDQVRQRTRTTGAKSVITHSPVQLPGGKVTVTATAEADRATVQSSTRGPNPFQLNLGRTRVEGGLAVDVPLTSRRERALAALGDISVNASFRVREVERFGSLRDTTFGTAWSPIEGIQLLATVKRSAAAPDMAALATPAYQTPNATVFDYGSGHTELVTMLRGGNPDLAAEHRLVRSLALTIKPFAKREWRVSATYETTTIRDQTGTVYAITPQTEALLPDLLVRDSTGKLISVAYRPINFAVERQRALNLVVNANGTLGKPQPRPGGAVQPVPSYYGGIGPSVKFSDRLQLRPGTPELDLLGGDTVIGGGNPRVSGYFYGGINYLDLGATFDGWYGGANRVRSADPAGDVRFSPILLLNVGAYFSAHRLVNQNWARKLRLQIDVKNAFDAHPNAHNGYGKIPNRLQPDYLEPVGRTVTLTLRKLF